MPSLDMTGPYVFSRDEVNAQITRTSAGNYALGYLDDNEENFFVLYVGRSDSDVKTRLCSHFNENNQYTHFKYSYATSPKAAFEKECKNYHEFKGLHNTYHPDRPAGTNWKCPHCDKFD